MGQPSKILSLLFGELTRLDKASDEVSDKDFSEFLRSVLP
jgi:hypothetical protein